MKRTAASLAVAAMALCSEATWAAPVPLSKARPFFFALSVRDAEASAEWYGRVFGFEPTRAVDLEERGIRIRLLRRAGAFLELTELADARELSDFDPPVEKRHLLRGVFKIGFAVDDLDAARASLDGLGIPLRGEAITEPDGSMRSLQIKDPDGNVIQLFELLNGAG